MLTFNTYRYFTILTFLFFSSGASAADSNSSFSFGRFDGNSSFESNIALYGDAMVVDGGSSVQLTASSSSSKGRVMYRKPIKLVEGRPWKSVSFSTDFEFSLWPGNGDGLAFILVPSSSEAKVFGNSSFGLSSGPDKNKIGVVAVEFDTLRDYNFKDLNENHVGIDVGRLVSAEAKNLSSVNVELGSGQKLHSWIDYEASSKRLEVRLGKFHDYRPVGPLISYRVDFSKIWKDEEVLVGLVSSNGNSSQTCHMYSWNFKLRHVPLRMHSEPLDPRAFAKEGKTIAAPKKNDCVLRMLAALIFGTVCGALGAFVALYLWTIFGNRRPVAPVELVMRPEEFEYKKVEICVDKAIEDGKSVVACSSKDM